MVAQVDALSGVVVEQADRRDASWRIHPAVAGRHARRDAARGDEVALAEVGWDVALELIGGIAVAVADDDLVAGEQRGTAAVGAFEARVLADLEHLGEDEVSRARRMVAGHHAGDASA